VLAGRWGIILLAVPDKGAYEQAEKSHCSLSKYYGKKFFMHHLPA
jgi:hypothetical protein